MNCSLRKILAESYIAAVAIAVLLLLGATVSVLGFVERRH